MIDQYEGRYPQPMECLGKSLEEYLTCLRLPESHPRRVRTANSFEWFIQQARRRTKVLGSMPYEQAGLSLIHAVLLDVSRHWRDI